MRTIYICEDSVTGMLSAIYDAWMESRDKVAGIGLKECLEQQLFCEYKEVKASERKAGAVVRLIRKYLGDETYRDFYQALLSEDPEKADAVFRVMQSARSVRDSRKIMEHLSDPAVEKVFTLSRQVGNEAHRFLEFVRFRELENGVLFSEIAPKNRILSCIADHFADRFPFLYFAREYGLTYLSAFSGCAEEAQPSVQAVAALIDAVERDGAPAIYVIEMSTQDVARAVAEQTGVPIVEMHSCQSVTGEEFAAGESYLSLMTRNVEALRRGLF